MTDPVAKALWFIESHLTDDIALATIADATGVSRFHLSRAFGETLGLGVMHYVRGRRLTEAARDLCDGAPDILALALESGYRSHEAFTRAFQEQFGVAPQTVRRRKGLDNLPLVEAIRRDPTMAIDLQTPRLETGELLLVAGYSERFTYETIARIPLLWQRFAPTIGSVPAQKGYDTYGVCFNSGDESFEYLAAVEVASLEGLPPDLRGLRIPAATYAVFENKGHIATLRTTMEAIWSSWLPASGLTVTGAPYFERYDERFDPQTGSGTVEIWIPVAR